MSYFGQLETINKVVSTDVEGDMAQFLRFTRNCYVDTASIDVYEPIILQIWLKELGQTSELRFGDVILTVANDSMDRFSRGVLGASRLLGAHTLGWMPYVKHFTWDALRRANSHGSGDKDEPAVSRSKGRNLVPFTGH